MFFLEIVKAIVFGIVEGFTEWLPISSTGHLILFQNIIHLSSSDEFWNVFKVCIQLGAILAVCVLYFRKLFPFLPGNTARERRKIYETWLKVIVACLPAAIVGIPLDDILDEYLSTPTVISAMLIIYGVIFIVLENANKKKVFPIRNIRSLSVRTAFLIGIFQCLSLIPGTSRSGATILGAMILGCSRTLAAEFSFFMGVPVMFGASLVKILKHGLAFAPYEIVILLVAMLSAFVTAACSINFLMHYIRRHDFKVFGVYRIVLGVIVIIWFAVLGH